MTARPIRQHQLHSVPRQRAGQPRAHGDIASQRRGDPGQSVCGLQPVHCHRRRQRPDDLLPLDTTATPTAATSWSTDGVAAGTVALSAASWRRPPSWREPAEASDDLWVMAYDGQAYPGNTSFSISRQRAGQPRAGGDHRQRQRGGNRRPDVCRLQPVQLQRCRQRHVTYYLYDATPGRQRPLRGRRQRWRTGRCVLSAASWRRPPSWRGHPGGSTISGHNGL